MTIEASSGPTLSLGDSPSPPGSHRFSHAAMATVFEIHCVHTDRRYAHQAARAAFDLVDGLERDLSRFAANSDIARINVLTAGQSTRVSPWTMECLEIARQIYELTGKAFDVSIGSGMERLELVPDEFTVHALEDGARLDLGGIGKGYAVDRMAELVEEWDIPRALVHGGFSSVLALESPPDRDGWPLTLSAPGPGEDRVLARVPACQMALSASGVRKGDHILDPRSGHPADARRAAWVTMAAGTGYDEERRSSAAIADALSTAFMILSLEEVADLCRSYPGLEAWLLSSPANGGATPPLVHLGGQASS
jgi:FAD:protein FMN transferase